MRGDSRPPNLRSAPDSTTNGAILNIHIHDSYIRYVDNNDEINVHIFIGTLEDDVLTMKIVKLKISDSELLS